MVCNQEDLITPIEDKLISPKQLGLMVKQSLQHMVLRWLTSCAMNESAIKDLHIFKNSRTITQAFR